MRFSRDRRGYEHTYLIHATPKKGAAARILYWYRTPPGVRVGRPAFDPQVRQTLEAQYPGVDFDWPAILSATFPPAENEHWRERRRAERAAKQARQAASRDDAGEVSAGQAGEAGEDEIVESPPAFAADAAVTDTSPAGGSVEVDPLETSLTAESAALDDESDEGGDEEEANDDAPTGPSGQPQHDGSSAAVQGQGTGARRRRRRGGRRRRRLGGPRPADGSGAGEPPVAVGGAESEAASVEVRPDPSPDPGASD